MGFTKQALGKSLRNAAAKWMNITDDIIEDAFPRAQAFVDDAIDAAKHAGLSEKEITLAGKNAYQEFVGNTNLDIAYDTLDQKIANIVDTRFKGQFKAKLSYDRNSDIQNLYNLSNKELDKNLTGQLYNIRDRGYKNYVSRMENELGRPLEKEEFDLLQRAGVKRDLYDTDWEWKNLSSKDKKRFKEQAARFKKQHAYNNADFGGYNRSEINELYDTNIGETIPVAKSGTELQEEAAQKIQNEKWLKSENDAIDALEDEKQRVRNTIKSEKIARQDKALDNLSLEAEGIKNSDTIVSNVNNVPVDQQTPIKNLQKYDSYSSPDGLPNPNNTPPAMDIFGRNGKAGYSGVQTPISNGATIANTSSGGPKITLTQQEMDALATGNGDPVEIMRAAQARATKAEQAANRVSSAQNLGLSQESQNIADLMLEAEGVSNAETIVTGPGKFVKTSQEAWNNQWGGKKKVIEKANDEFAFGVKHAVGAIVAAGGLMTLFSSTGGQQNNAQLYGQQPLY